MPIPQAMKTHPSNVEPRLLRRSPVGRLRRALLALAVALLAVAATTPLALAEPAHYDGASSDGEVVVFSTKDRLVAGDTDGFEDVYARTKDPETGLHVTREVSLGPSGGNAPFPAHFDAVAGSKVFFSTQESLLVADKDGAEDVYMRNLANNSTTLISQGSPACVPGCGTGAAPAGFAAAGVAAGGDRVFFTTKEQLSFEDEDEASDVYMRDLVAGDTTLVSQGASSCAPACGNGSQGAFFRQASADGEKVVFTTREALAAGDVGEAVDIYQRNIGASTTQLVSTPGTCPTLPSGENCDPTFRPASRDGSHVFFETREQTSSQDTDSSQDVYDWSGGTAALASIGAAGAGNGAFDVTYAGSSANGDAVYLETNEALDSAADTDSGKKDVYVRSGGATSLISTGPAAVNGPEAAEFQWASPDGSSTAVFFSTAEPLVAEDEDAAEDVYMRSGSTTTLVSTGPEGGNGSGNAAFSRATPDGSHVFFLTPESLVAADSDSQDDVYERTGSETTLISTVVGGGNGEHPARLNAVSNDGTIAFFTTEERLLLEDPDNEDDVYARSGETTELVSGGGNEGREELLAPEPPRLEATDPSSSPESPGESTEPKVIGRADTGATIKLYTTSNCTGEPVATGSAGELASPGIAAAVAAGSTTHFYATAEVEGLVSICSEGITYVQKTAPTPPPAEEGGSGGTGESSGGSGGGGSSTATPSTGEAASQPSPPASTNYGGSGPRPTYGHGVPFVTPVSRITFGPSFKTKLRRPVFRFADATGQPGTRFICKLDHRHWHDCTSPVRLHKLPRGRHVFQVKAMNATGVWETGKSRRAFRMVRGHRGRR
jgi:hypothetical protein